MARVQQGDNAAVAKVNKLGKAMNGFKGAAKFTGWGLLTELGFSAPLAAVDYAKGANKDEIISNATYGLFGKSEEEQLKEKYADYGKAQKFQDTYDKLLKQESALDDQTGYGPIVNPQNIKNTEKKLTQLVIILIMPTKLKEILLQSFLVFMKEWVLNIPVV